MIFTAVSKLRGGTARATIAGLLCASLAAATAPLAPERNVGELTNLRSISEGMLANRSVRVLQTLSNRWLIVSKHRRVDDCWKVMLRSRYER